MISLDDQGFQCRQCTVWELMASLGGSMRDRRMWP